MTHIRLFISEVFINQYTNTLYNRLFNKTGNQCSHCSVVLATGTWMIDEAVIATRENRRFTWQSIAMEEASQ